MSIHEVISKKHSCYYKTMDWVSEAAPGRQLVEHIRPECLNGCCLNGDYNEFFKIKPTAAEIQQWMDEFEIKGYLAKQHNEERRKLLMSGKSSHSQLITINISQDYKQPIKAQWDIINALRDANYKWMSPDAVATFEYYGKDGKWNPHIHIVITRTTKRSTIEQQLTRKFFMNHKTKERVKKWAYCIYKNVDVADRDKSRVMDYVNGIKAEEKMEGVNKDREYREKNGVPHLIKIKE